MRVLSLFDGMSCGRLAFDRAGINIDAYYASEIDKYAISVSNYNWNDIEHVGSVNNWPLWREFYGVDDIDIIIAGSPCQGFSFAGKQLAFDDPRSKLFFQFINCVKEWKPKRVLLENVKMKREFQDIITDELEKCGIGKIYKTQINSNLVSAQNRERIYWTNFPVEIPTDKGIILRDIVHESVDNKLSEKEIEYMLNGSGNWSPSSNNRFETYLNYPDRKHHCLTANLNKGVPYNCMFEPLSEYIVPFDKTLKILDKEVQKGKVGYFRKDSQANRVYYIHNKAVTLCGDSGGGAAKMGQYLFGCITPDRVDKRQNRQRFNDGTKFYTLTAQDKHGVLVEGYIRKLTPVECERLQTVPENYTSCVSNSQRYKMLGNGWTVDVISHIFEEMRGVM